MTLSGADTGRYRLDSRIATGGMGEVWRATDTVLGRQVAVKLLKQEYADDPSFLARFSAEARHAASLHHPNIASVFDVGELPGADGSGHARPYLVMELVPGEPLSALLRSGTPMPADRAADLVAQAADAVAAAHAMGIVHRDVKPANLLVTPEGIVKITDFGIARAGEGTAITQTGQIVGTPHYLSPEQAEGLPATNASDIYALGVVLYECLAGERPFNRDSPIQVALAHLRDEVPPLPDSVPERMRSVVATALAKAPADRFGSAGDLASALRGNDVAAMAAAGAGAGAAAGTVTPDPTATRVLGTPTPAAAAPPTSTRRRRRAPAWWPWAAAALAVLVVVLATAALAGGGGDQDNTARDNPGAGPTVEQQGGGEPSEQPAESAEPEDDRVRVDPADYVGQQAKDAKEDLEALGFSVTEEKVAATSADQEKDTVAAVDPHGLVEPDSTLTLQVYEAYVEPEESDDEDDEEPGKSEKSKGKGKDEG